MKTIKHLLDRLVEMVSLVIFVVMVFLVLFQVFVRYALNSPSAYSETLTRYLFVWLVLVTATYAFGQRDHMCITFLKDKLPKKKARLMNLAIEGITLVFAAGVMVYGGVRIAAMQMVQLDAVLKIPTGIIYTIIPVCGIGIVLYCLCNLYELLKKEAN